LRLECFVGVFERSKFFGFLFNILWCPYGGDTKMHNHHNHIKMSQYELFEVVVVELETGWGRIQAF
jgi:hypothetical protein